MTIDQALEAAVEHHRAGRLREAETIYRQVLSSQPDNADALHLLGFIAHQVNRRSDALNLIQRAISLRPRAADFYHNLGVVLAADGRSDQAIAAWRQTLAIRPQDARAAACIASTLESMGKRPQAVEAWRQACKLKPDSADSWARLASVLVNLGQVQEATDCCRRALELSPSCAMAHYTLGTALKDKGRIREAIASYRRSLIHDPENRAAYSNILYGLHFDPHATLAEIYDEHWVFNAVYARPLEKLVRPHANDRSPQRRLRVGYISPDFRAHSTCLFTTPLFRWHDRQHFEIFCYSDVAAPDPITQDLRQKADAWRDIVHMSDEQAAEAIRADGIDILVDLALHTHGGRPLLFARKPAPIQLSWLGYPGTSGLTTMDYRLTDPWLDPPGLNDQFYFEQSVRLPDTMWSYEPVESGLEPGPSPVAQRGHITFGSLNNFSKANDLVVGMWADVLSAVSGSRLIVMAPAGECRQRFLAALAQKGVSAERIEFPERLPWLDYMAMYHRIDIVLDTFPWNGHTMSLDALWMGVPVVTLCGKTPVSRAGLCFLSNLGLSELVAHTPAEYVQIATRLAADLPKLSRLRATIRERMVKSPLTDTRRFARNVEAIYRMMWKRWISP